MPGHSVCALLSHEVDDGCTLAKSKLLFVLNHKLNPLKVCLLSIIEEFHKQATAHLFTLSNDFSELDLSRDFGGVERLDKFFPFDPCLLKRCNRNFIRPYFVYWKHARTTYEGGDDEDSSDEDIAEDFEIENSPDFVAKTLDDQEFDLVDFDYAMNKMSITPKNNFNFRFLGGRMQMPSKIRPSMSPESL